jgi:hypothetical protein
MDTPVLYLSSIQQCQFCKSEAQYETDQAAVAEAKASGIAKLLTLTLTEAEANALVK